MVRQALHLACAPSLTRHAGFASSVPGRFDRLEHLCASRPPQKNKKKRTDPRYALLFGKKRITEINSEPYPEQIRTVRGLVRALDDPSLATVKQHKATLQAAADTLETALAERETMYGGEGDASRELAASTDEARRTFKTTYRRLLELFDDDEKAAAGFYPAGSSRNKPPGDKPQPPA